MSEEAQLPTGTDVVNTSPINDDSQQNTSAEPTADAQQTSNTTNNDADIANTSPVETDPQQNTSTELTEAVTADAQQTPNTTSDDDSDIDCGIDWDEPSKFFETETKKIECTQWSRSVKIFGCIGTPLFYFLYTAVLLAQYNGTTGSVYEPMAQDYPNEIQCLISDKKSVTSADYYCTTGGDIVTDYVYYQPQCSVIDESFSDTNTITVNLGHNCGDDDDIDDDWVFVNKAEKGDILDCYTNDECTDIVFQDYMNWKRYKTAGILWLIASVISSLIFVPWFCIELFKNGDETGQCCRMGCLCCCPLIVVIPVVLFTVIY